MAAAKQHVANAIADRLVAMKLGEVFDYAPADNTSYSLDLPCFVYYIGQFFPLNYMGVVQGEQSRDFITNVQIAIICDADLGSAAAREVEEKIYQELHQTFLVCEGYSTTKIRCLSRGDIKTEDDRLYVIADTFEIIGSE